MALVLYFLNLLKKKKKKNLLFFVKFFLFFIFIVWVQQTSFVSCADHLVQSPVEQWPVYQQKPGPQKFQLLNQFLQTQTEWYRLGEYNFIEPCFHVCVCLTWFFLFWGFFFFSHKKLDWAAVFLSLFSLLFCFLVLHCFCIAMCPRKYFDIWKIILSYL